MVAFENWLAKVLELNCDWVTALLDFDSLEEDDEELLLLELDPDELLDDSLSLLLLDDFLFSDDLDSVSNELCLFFWMVDREAMVFWKELDLRRLGVTMVQSPLFWWTIFFCRSPLEVLVS